MCLERWRSQAKPTNAFSTCDATRLRSLQQPHANGIDTVGQLIAIGERENFRAPRNVSLLLDRFDERDEIAESGLGGCLAPVLPFDEDMERIRIEQQTWTGTVWVFGWLFTIGYVHLTFWKGVLAILLWPYYIGVALSAFAPR